MNAFGLGIVNNLKRSANENFLTFSSSNPFSISFANKRWDGVLEYSTDTVSWTEWGASEISSVNNALYLRGSENTVITGIEAMDSHPDYAIQIDSSSSVECSGNIMTLLDYENADNAVMGEGAFLGLFAGCTSLTAAPELPATTLTEGCYSGMFNGCENIKISGTQTGIYQKPWRIPTVGTISNVPSWWGFLMLEGTGGTFSYEPSINTTYYQAG